MAEHKRQHFIPQGYLKAWCDPATPVGHEPYVWLFTRDGSNFRRKAPSNIFHETDMYTVRCPDGERNLVLEKTLSHLESDFCALRESKLSRGDPLGLADRALLCMFAAAMQSRTPTARQHVGAFWSQVREMGRALAEWGKTATPKQRQAASMPRSERSQAIPADLVESLATSPLQTSMTTSIGVQTPLLLALDLAIFGTEAPGFITSDNPCIWFDPEACKRPPAYQGLGLAYPTIEVTVPVSPRQILVLNRGGYRGYLRAPDVLVNEFNRRTRFGCREHFVNNVNAIHPFWFDPGVEPEDSWRKRNPKPG